VKFPQSLQPEDPKLDLSCFQVPSLTYEVKYGRLFGRASNDMHGSAGSAVSAFNNIDQSMIRQCVYLKSIFARHGAMIDHLDVTYGFRDHGIQIVPIRKL
jgi:hypothetical protein